MFVLLFQLLCEPEENFRNQPQASAYETNAEPSQCKYDHFRSAFHSSVRDYKPRYQLFQANADDQTASDLAVVLFETATLRSGYQLVDTKAYGDRIERMLRLSMNIDLDEQVNMFQVCITQYCG